MTSNTAAMVAVQAAAELEAMADQILTPRTSKAKAKLNQHAEAIRQVVRELSEAEARLPESGPVQCPPGYVALVAPDGVGGFALSYRKDGEVGHRIDIANLPSFLMGVMAQRDEWQERYTQAMENHGFTREFLEGESR